MRNLLLFFIFFFCLSACAPDPRNAADAYATQSQADQAAQAAEQSRSLALQTYLAQSPADVAAHNRLINGVSLVGTFALGLLILASAVSFALLVWKSVQAAALYAQRHAEVSANLIPLDRRTGQYPLLISFQHGVFTLANPNKSEVLQLDTRQPADRLAISATAQVQMAGLLAAAASRSRSPQDIASINPAVIEIPQEQASANQLYESLVQLLNRSANE